jgi:hypothetical protein
MVPGFKLATPGASAIAFVGLAFFASRSRAGAAPNGEVAVALATATQDGHIAQRVPQGWMETVFEYV